MNEHKEHRKRLKILERHLGDNFYTTGQYHNNISDAMEEYAQMRAGENSVSQPVSNRRELLFSFKEDYNKRNFDDCQICDQDIELFLKQ